LCSALLPLSNVAALFLWILVACLARAQIPFKRAALIVLSFTGTLLFLSWVGWWRLGESPLRRYGVALPVAAITAVWLVRGPLRSIERAPRAALCMLLVVFPFGRLRLQTGTHAGDVAIAVGFLFLLAVLVIAQGASRASLLGFA